MNTNKGFAGIAILIAAIVAVAAGGAWFYYSAHPSQNPLPANHQNPAPNIYQAGNVSDANNQFALDLYKRYAAEKNGTDNIFFSPFSISSALAMTYEGAKGQTAQEIAGVFHFPSDINQMRSAYQTAFGDIQTSTSGYTLTTANALWVQKNYPLLPSYTSAIKSYYDGSVTNLDFIASPQAAASTINQWVAGQTNNKIQNIISGLDSSTRLVITNAIYFKGSWEQPFEKGATQDKTFTSGGGATASVPMMEQQDNFLYADTGDAQILEMPYRRADGQGASMFVLLPKGNNLSAFENELTLQKIENWEKGMQSTLVDVSLPKFHIETTEDMSQDLQAMGMPTAFSATGADFSGIANISNPSQNLYISDVIHKAFIDTDENGTEAAAATAVIIATAAIAGGPQPQPVIFNANHPFIFFIQDPQTQEILFFGRVVQPVKS